MSENLSRLGIIGLALIFCGQSFAALSKDEIDTLKKKEADYLLSVQQAGNAWEPPARGGMLPSCEISAKVLLALSDSGEDLTKKPLLDAVNQLAGFKNEIVSGAGLRMNVLSKPAFRARYKKVVDEDFSALARLSKPGLYGFSLSARRVSQWDMYSTYTAWAGMYEEKSKIPESAWIAFSSTLIKFQHHQPKLKAVHASETCTAHIQRGRACMRKKARFRNRRG